MAEVQHFPPDHNGTRLLKMIQARHPGYHPALSIADLAHKEEVEEDVKFRCHATLLKYIEPELRSIQIQAEVKETRVIRVSLFEAIDFEQTLNSKTMEETLTNAPKLPPIIDVEPVREQTHNGTSIIPFLKD